MRFGEPVGGNQKRVQHVEMVQCLPNLQGIAQGPNARSRDTRTCALVRTVKVRERARTKT